jgi:hypothetical protein
MNPETKTISSRYLTGLRDLGCRELLDHLGRLLAKEYLAILIPAKGPRATGDEGDKG